MMMCFLKMQERSHKSTTAGTTQMKSKASCKKLEYGEIGIRIPIMFCVEYVSDICK